ncbi:MAG: 3-phosphoshikimate 1-carboxyvinyltransferase [Nannocystaceae bacterium]|nr:3-phosphoshikimate 1-carboxyvinyltransferase [bacterium]
MVEVIQLQPPTALDWTLPVPGSKSITNRALLLAALAEGSSTLRGWLDADDTRHMRACLASLGVEVVKRDGALAVSGAGGRFTSTEAPQLFVGTAGTVARFLLAALAGSNVAATMDGTPRMRERPMAMLIDGLRAMGASLECTQNEGFIPVRVEARGQLRGGEVRLSRPASSQFVSGLVIAATLADGPTQVVLEQGTPARPYVDMTLRVLASFGGSAGWEQDTLHVEPSTLRGCDYTIEADASAASYPLTLAAIHGGRAQVSLGQGSMQGDAKFASVLERMGARVSQTGDATTVEGTGSLRGGLFDLTDMPDMTLTLAVAALFAEGPTEIRGVDILRHHESDRLAVAATELRKLGAEVEEYDDGLRIVPPAGSRPGAVEIDTYDDHRVAMAFAMAGHVAIRDPGCVAKTYPEYFNHLRQTGMVVAHA